MKNIVENFIEIKYVRKFCHYLLQRHRDETIDWFEEKNIPKILRFKLECDSNNEII